LRWDNLVDACVLVENSDQPQRQSGPERRRGERDEAAQADRDAEPVPAADHDRDAFGERGPAAGHVAALQPGEAEQLQGAGA
jgi:hypothetical protein